MVEILRALADAAVRLLYLHCICLLLSLSLSFSHTHTQLTFVLSLSRSPYVFVHCTAVVKTAAILATTVSRLMRNKMRAT
jgi:hypothetical protein